MNNSLIATAVLGVAASAASAQSSVTLYGRVDVGAGKYIGLADKQINGRNSRLGVRGVEDLGGGMQAFFHLEHRFDADTGVVTGEPTGLVNTNVATAARPPAGGPTPFWRGRSVVGLGGGFGRITVGRDYGAAALAIGIQADPWGWETVVGGSPAGARGNGYLILGGLGGVPGVTGSPFASVADWIWYNNSIKYDITVAGFSFAAQIAEANDNFTQAQRPKSFALTYGAGPLYAGIGYTDQAGVNDKWTTALLRYDFGFVKPSVFIGTGKDNADRSIRSYLLGATMPLGSGELRASYGENKVSGVKRNQQWGFGYHYALSKRTTLYADVARDRREPTSEKNAYDAGIKHNF